jgi:signal transduction histidine kinase
MEPLTTSFFLIYFTKQSLPPDQSLHFRIVILQINSTANDRFMKNRLSNLFSSAKSPFLAFEPTNRNIKVSVHQLINDLLASLQPLAHNRNNVLHNGVLQGLCFVAEENLLALKLWNLLGSALHARQNTNIHVLALVDDHKTTIAVKGAGTNLAFSICNSLLTV